MASNTFLPNVVNAVVLFYGGTLVLVGQMSAGALVAFMLYQQSLASAFRRPLEVDMQPKRQKLTSIDHLSQSQDSQKPAATSRAHRRKQASPKRAFGLCLAQQ